MSSVALHDLGLSFHFLSILYFFLIFNILIAFYQ